MKFTTTHRIYYTIKGGTRTHTTLVMLHPNGWAPTISEFVGDIKHSAWQFRESKWIHPHHTFLQSEEL